MNETTTKLSLFDTVELQLELERREKIKEESEKPKPELNPDYSPLRKLVIGYIDQVHKKGAAVDEEFDHYIFEVAVTAIYGKNVWGWINKKL